MARLDGKRALVTGGAAGIGRAIVEAFLREGARVLATDVDAARLAALSGDLDAGERLATCRADVASAADWQHAIGDARRHFGGLDILVNNAGIEVVGTIETVPEETWDRIMAINVKSIYLGVRAALPLLRESRGVIVNMASIAGLIGAAGWAAYVTSKHAVVGLTKCLALDYAADGIRVNAICPGMVETPMAERIVRVVGQGDPEAGRRALVAGVPLGRFIEPAEVAAVAVHLASDESRFTTGTTYVIDGGATATTR
ncbi:MAG: SDR family oxidoreductase [Sphaerobacter sp.]|nr:SDR family oxidoreductase [Sphaerobacter sp.]